MNLQNWRYTLSETKELWISPLMYQQITNKVFLKEKRFPVYITGEIDERPYTTGALASVSNHHVTATSRSGISYLMGEPKKEFLKFEQAVANDIPILYDWVLDLKQKETLRIAGTLYHNGQIEYINEQIDDQNYKKSTLDLQGHGTCFIVWDAINHFQEANLKQFHPVLFAQGILPNQQKPKLCLKHPDRHKGIIIPSTLRLLTSQPIPEFKKK